jgi:hypothetical protein
MSDWWTLSRNADLLASTLALVSTPPTFDEINIKFQAFEKKYFELLEILRRADKTIDSIDALIHPSLRQTLDEYNDFDYDSNVLRRGAGPFSKRELRWPPLPYKVARYVYTATDARQLNTKMDWQISIMQAKINALSL